MTALSIGAAFAGAIALAGSVYWLVAAMVVPPVLRRRTAKDARLAPVSVLRPMHGAHPGLERALESLAALHWPAPVQYVFGFQDGADPGLATVRAWRARWPGLDIEIVVDGARRGANAKVSNLIAMAARARHPLLAISDADIAVPADWLAALPAALARSGVGAVSLFYRGEGVAGVFSRLSAMAISYAFLPSAAFGWRTGLAHPCFGSTIGINRSILERLGGLEAFADRLADDYDLGRAVRAQGLAIAMPAPLVVHLCDESSLADLLAHELRWARTVRLIDPAGHFGSLLTHPLAFALMAAILAGAAPWTAGPIGLALAARQLAKARIDAVIGSACGPAWLLPLRDLMSFCVFVVSLFGRRVRWADARLTVDRAGRLAPGA